MAFSCHYRRYYVAVLEGLLLSFVISRGITTVSDEVKGYIFTSMYIREGFDNGGMLNDR